MLGELALPRGVRDCALEENAACSESPPYHCGALGDRALANAAVRGLTALPGFAFPHHSTIPSFHHSNLPGSERVDGIDIDAELHSRRRGIGGDGVPQNFGDVSDSGAA